MIFKFDFILRIAFSLIWCWSYSLGLSLHLMYDQLRFHFTNIDPAMITYTLPHHKNTKTSYSGTILSYGLILSAILTPLYRIGDHS